MDDGASWRSTAVVVAVFSFVLLVPDPTAGNHPVRWRVKPCGSSTSFRPFRVTRHPPGWDGQLSPEAQLPAVRNDRSEPLEPDRHSHHD